MKVKSESEVAQSCPTLIDPMDWSLPGSSIHGIFQARVLEWGATAFSARDVRGKQRLLSYVGWSGLSSKLAFLKEIKNQVIQEKSFPGKGNSKHKEYVLVHIRNKKSTHKLHMARNLLTAVALLFKMMPGIC